jgi:hypothetical protein
MKSRRFTTFTVNKRCTLVMQITPIVGSKCLPDKPPHRKWLRPVTAKHTPPKSSSINDGYETVLREF